ncbi:MULTISPECIES: hypothetical protein [Prauserella salsuginis group]|uniref:Uncharacterized protein n=2 Tax=Prauserella salsuginis group TaxID=2893672 RepID=A0A839XPD5_9PSEU|nr:MULTISPECIES: hypothetical protein [Prauserella salsuginis group]MBB3661806.1 hypothetical protein [Prauserella sediminis]MCR3722817.1 hypothetical protein [Prauserella flava]MCR3737128.1 hypothetical protein [Prauserella salsuginis]
MRQQAESGKPAIAVGWRSAGLAVVAGLVITALAWLAGPSLFATAGGADHRTVEATVTDPTDCTDAAAGETVRFTDGGTTRTGTLSGCGHDKDETVHIAVPDQPAEPAGEPISVHLASTDAGMGELGRPLGMALLVLSCAAGGVYAFLVIRGPRQGGLPGRFA